MKKHESVPRGVSALMFWRGRHLLFVLEDAECSLVPRLSPHMDGKMQATESWAGPGNEAILSTCSSQNQQYQHIQKKVTQW